MRMTRAIVTLQNESASQKTENIDQIKLIENKNEIIEHLEAKQKQLQMLHGSELGQLRDRL